MASIKEVGSRIQNLYFQDYAETSQFWDENDFNYHAGAAYAELLRQEYINEYNLMRADGEYNIVSFSHDWLKVEPQLKREKDEMGFYINLPQPIMSFMYDKRDVGVQNILSASGKMGTEYIRSSIDELWVDSFLPISPKVYWALLRDKIYLNTNVGEPPLLSKLVYVPGISDDLDIPDTRVWSVMAITLEMMRKAAANYVVKETSDQNANELPVTEADRNLVK